MTNLEIENIREFMKKQVFSTKEEILEDFCDQPELARFISIELSEPDDDGTELDDETATQLFIVMIAFTTLLSRSAQAA